MASTRTQISPRHAGGTGRLERRPEERTPIAPRGGDVAADRRRTRGMRLVLALVVGATAALAATAGPAYACSCAPPDPRSLLGQADGAFVGRLLAVRVVDPPEPGEPISSGDPTDYIYRVGRVYNGGPGLQRGRTVRVRSVRSGATCGLPRVRGRLYGLLVTRRNRRWHSSLCSVVSPAAMRRAAGGGYAAATPAGSPGSAACG